MYHRFKHLPMSPSYGGDLSHAVVMLPRVVSWVMLWCSKYTVQDGHLGHAVVF